MAFSSRFDNRKPKQADDLVNERVRFKEVLVIDQNGDQLGVKSSREALDIAYDANLDLVCVAPNAKPPVCRIMDFGKYLSLIHISLKRKQNTNRFKGSQFKIISYLFLLVWKYSKYCQGNTKTNQFRHL